MQHAFATILDERTVVDDRGVINCKSKQTHQYYSILLLFLRYKFVKEQTKHTTIL